MIITFMIMLLVLCTVGCVWWAFKMSVKATETNEKLNTVLGLQEHALDVLERCYNELVRVASTPVLFDDANVRSLLSVIKNARDAVFVVASEISEEADTLVEEEN